jgi:protein-tyrosine-phosphatase
MPFVLFVCAENRVRSVICEYRLRQILNSRGDSLAKAIEVASAGCGLTEEIIKKREAVGWIQNKNSFGLPPSLYAIESMRRRGMDISQSRSRELNETIAQKADLIIAFEDPHKEMIVSRYPIAKGKTFTLQEIVGYDGYLMNPYVMEGAYAFNSATKSWSLADWYEEGCITEVEHMLWWGVDKIIDFLKKKKN